MKKAIVGLVGTQFGRLTILSVVEKYPIYGGRGIKFLFTSFEEWYAELGEKPEPKSLYSVDRIDSDSHYMVGNVRWSRSSVQRNNQRRMVAA